MSCFVAGIFKETGAAKTPDRANVIVWLSQIVLAGRAYGIDIVDDVYGDCANSKGFAAECAAGRAMGSTGKSLIHPTQIEPARRAFSATDAEIESAILVVGAFAKPENAGKGVISPGWQDVRAPAS